MYFPLCLGGEDDEMVCNDWCYSYSCDIISGIGFIGVGVLDMIFLHPVTILVSLPGYVFVAMAKDD